MSTFQAGAIGEPGQRTFYIYIETSTVHRWFTAEKTQVNNLAEQSLEVLNRMPGIDESTVERLVRGMGDLPWPTSPEDIAFRIGSMTMRMDEEDRLTLILADVDGETTASFVVTREQLRAMSLLALEAVNAGRPLCPKCHLPEDPQGHDCPSTNGHRPIQA